MPPLPGRRGTRRSLWKRAAAGLDEVGGSSCGTITSVRIPLPHFFAWTLELEPWVSLWSNHFGEESTSPPAWASDMFGFQFHPRMCTAFLVWLPVSSSDVHCASWSASSFIFGCALGFLVGFQFHLRMCTAHLAGSQSHPRMCTALLPG